MRFNLLRHQQVGRQQDMKLLKTEQRSFSLIYRGIHYSLPKNTIDRASSQIPESVLVLRYRGCLYLSCRYQFSE